MPTSSVDYDLAWSSHSPHHSLSVLKWAKLICVTSYHQKGASYFLSVAFPSQSASESIEFRFIGIVGHPHKPLFERRRGFIENCSTTRFQASGHNRNRSNSWL